MKRKLIFFIIYPKIGIDNQKNRNYNWFQAEVIKNEYDPYLEKLRDWPDEVSATGVCSFARKVLIPADLCVWKMRKDAACELSIYGLFTESSFLIGKRTFLL